MAEEVKIVDVAGGPAAEATLQELLKVMKGMSGGAGAAGAGTDSAAKAQELYTESVTRGTRSKRENTKAVDNSTSALKSMASAIGSFAGGVLSFFTQTISGAIGVTSNLVKAFGDGTGTLTDMVSQVPLIGSILGMFTGYLDETLTVFQQLSSSGASFNNNLTDLRISAAGAKVSLESFAGLIGNNTEMLAAFGGTVTQGAKAFGRVRTAFRGHEQELLNMGMSFEEINESIMGYMAVNRAGSRAQTQDAATLASHSASYAKSLMTLSKLTGEDVKAQREKLAAQQNDIAFQMQLAKLRPEERAKVQAGLAEAMAAGGETGAEYFKQQFLGLPPLTRSTQLFEATMGDSAKAIRRMKTDALDAGVSLKEYNDGAGSRLADFVEGQAKAGASMESILMAAAGGLDGPASELAEIMQQSGMQFTNYLDENDNFNRKKFEQDIATAKKEQNKTDATVKALTSFQSTLRDIKLAFETNIVAPITKAVGPQLNALATAFSNANSTTLTPFIEKIGSAISQITSDINEFGVAGALENLLDRVGEAAAPIFGSMFDKIYRMIFGESEAAMKERLGETKTNLQEQSKEIQSQIDALKTELPNLSGASADASQKQIAGLEQQLAHTKKQINETDTELKNAKGSVGVFGGMFDNILPSIEGITKAFTDLDSGTLAVIGGGAIGLLGLAVALKAIAGPAALVLASMGLAAGGLGFMFMGVSAVIDSITDGVDKLATGLDKLSKIDGSNLSVVGEGIGAISPHLLDIAKSGVVASFISDGAFENLAAGINALNLAQVGNMAAVGAGLSVIQEALLEFTATGILTNLVGKNALPDIADGITALNNAQTANLSAIGQAIDAAAGPLAKFAGAGFITNLVGENALAHIAAGITALNDAQVSNLTAIAEGMKLLAEPLANFAAGGILASLMGEDTLTNLANGLTSLDSVGGTNLPTIAKGMDALSGPLLKIAGASAVLTLIGSDSFGQLATQLKKFEELNPDTLNAMGPALTSLNKGIQAFTGGDMLEAMGKGLTDLVGGLFGDDGFEDLVENLKKFEEVNTQKIYEVGQGLQGIANFVGGDIDVGEIKLSADGLQKLNDITKTLDSDAITSYNEALEKLVEVLSKLNEELGTDATTPQGPDTPAAGALGNLTSTPGLEGDSASKLERLNTLVSELVALQTESNKYTKGTMRAVGGNLQMGV